MPTSMLSVRPWMLELRSWLSAFLESRYERIKVWTPVAYTALFTKKLEVGWSPANRRPPTVNILKVCCVLRSLRFTRLKKDRGPRLFFLGTWPVYPFLPSFSLRTTMLCLSPILKPRCTYVLWCSLVSCHHHQPMSGAQGLKISRDIVVGKRNDRYKIKDGYLPSIKKKPNW